MNLITAEDIRFEERWERWQCLVLASLVFVWVIVMVGVGPWDWYYKLLFGFGAAAYYVGYCKCYPHMYESSMKDHPMRYSSNYRKTDGHLVAFLASFFWPILWLGRTIIRLVVKAFRRR